MLFKVTWVTKDGAKNQIDEAVSLKTAQFILFLLSTSEYSHFITDAKIEEVNDTVGS